MDVFELLQQMIEIQSISGKEQGIADFLADYLERAGFAITAERNRRDFALAFFANLRAKTSAAGGPPPLGLHVLMGKTAPEKVQNMIDWLLEAFNSAKYPWFGDDFIHRRLLRLADELLRRQVPRTS